MRWGTRAGSSGAAIALAIAACAACRAVNSDPSAAAHADVRAELETYYRDLSARDWPAFQDHFWPGAALTTVWQPPGESAVRVAATSVEDFVRMAPQGPGSRAIFAEWIERLELRVEGPLAQAWVHYGARFGDPGDVTEWRGVDSFSLLRHAGRWRIASLAYAGEDGPR